MSRSRLAAAMAVAVAAVALPSWARAQTAPAPAPAAPATPGAATAAPARVLTLAQALEAARQHQPQLRQARAGSAAAGARADEARSGLLPQLSGNGTYEKSTFNVAPRPGFTSIGGHQPNSWATRDFWSFGATLNQLIYDFGQTSGRWRAAQASAASQRDSEQATAAQTALGVRVAFFSARAARDLVGVARDNLANMQAHLRQTEGFVQFGTHPAIDLALARTNESNAEVQLINAENGYLTAKAQLNQAMGDEGPTDYEVSDDQLGPVAGEDETLEPLLAEALKARPDYAALQQQARAQELTVGAVRGGYAPSLGASAGVTAAGSSVPEAVPNGFVGVTLTWNIFQGGLTSAQEREARANLEAAHAQADVLRQQVRVDVEQARLAVRAGKSALAAAQAAVVNAREQLRLAEGRYVNGVGSAIELGDSQVALATAAGQRVQAEYNLSTSRAQLLRALGREPFP
jgi:outer membrane protein